MAIDNAGLEPAEARLAKALVGFKLRDNAFHLPTLTAAWTVLILLGCVIASLVVGSIPAIRASGLNFLSTEMRNPVTEQFGAMAAVYGTVATSIIAMAIAVPSALGIAIFLTELCPYALCRPIGIAIELLAGIPSIIYGIWGLFVLAPFMQEYVQPGLISVFANVPVLSDMFAGPPAELNDRVEAALVQAALWDEVKDKLNASDLSLSGGPQQRLCIARTVAIQPEGFCGTNLALRSTLSRPRRSRKRSMNQRL